MSIFLAILRWYSSQPYTRVIDVLRSLPAILLCGNLDPRLFGNIELMEPDITLFAARGIEAGSFLEGSALIIERARLGSLVERTAFDRRHGESEGSVETREVGAAGEVHQHIRHHNTDGIYSFISARGEELEEAAETRTR